MSKAGKMEGELVSIEEAAKGLGFGSVDEMKRWETELGQRCWNLEEKLRTVTYDKNHFLYNGMRQYKLLEEIYNLIIQNKPLTDELKFAVGVAVGKEIDWDNKLVDFYKEVDERFRMKTKE